MVTRPWPFWSNARQVPTAALPSNAEMHSYCGAYGCVLPSSGATLESDRPPAVTRPSQSDECRPHSIPSAASEKTPRPPFEVEPTAKKRVLPPRSPSHRFTTELDFEF